MSKNDNTAVLESSVFAKFMAGVAAIVPPEAVDAPEVGPGDVALVVCDDFLRRVHTYHTELVHALRPLENELRDLQRDIAGAAEAIQGKAHTASSLFAAMEDMLTPENKAKVARIADIEAELGPQAGYLKWVGDLFWVEAKSRFPALHGHPNIALRSDWSLVVVNETQSEREEELEAFLSSMGGGGSLEHLFRRRAA